MTEEERAALYREKACARERAALARYRKLAGDRAEYEAALVRTEALRRDEGWDPVELVTDEERLLVANG